MSRRNYEWNVIPDFLNVDEALENVSQCIVGKLYVGDEEFSEDLGAIKALGITHVISIEGPNLERTTYGTTHNDLVYLRIKGVYDSWTNNITPHIKKALEFFDESDKILIHCQMGVSRSASLAIACLMHSFPDWEMEQAYDTVKAARPHIGPEPEFLFQIQDYFDKERMKGRTT